MKWRELDRGYSDHLEQVRSKSPEELLGVEPNASSEQIKAAYRRLAKVYHPDRADGFLRQNNAEVLKVVNSAYATLMRRKRS